MKWINNQKIRWICRFPALVIIIFAVLVTCAQPTEPGNSPPIILSLTPTKRYVNFQESITIKANVKDADNDTLSFLWFSEKGNFTFTSLDSAVWNAPDTSGRISISLKVNDDFGGQDVDSILINVQNQGPVIHSLTASNNNIMVGNIIILKVDAEDPDGGSLIYKWESNSGEFIGDVSADTVFWRASTTVENVNIRITVTDNIGDFAYKDITIKVFQETGSVWVADTFNNEIVKLAHNGVQLLRLQGFNQPKKVIVDLSDRSLWIADWGNNRLVKYSSENEFLFQVPDLDRPTGIAVQSNGNIWITTMQDTSQVIEVSYNGTILRRLNGFKDPQSIDVNRLSGEIWIADTGNDRVVMLSPNVPDGYDLNSSASAPQYAVIYGTSGQNIYTNPEALAVNQATGDCWIADTGNHRIVHISKNDQTEFIISGFLNPRGIDVNIRDGSCWVANTGDNEVVKISPEIFQLPTTFPWAYNIDLDAGFHNILSGYELPWSISVNSSENIIWFSDDYRVVKVKDEDQKISVIKEFVNFNAPRSIIVNPGIRP